MYNIDIDIIQMKGVRENIIYDGRPIEMEWFECSSYPENLPVTQVFGFCANRKGEILIVKNEEGWGFPGGHPELGEKPEETLAREIMEEGYATIKNPRLVGFVDVVDAQNDSFEGNHYLHLRYVAQTAKVHDFKKEFETTEREFISPPRLIDRIDWLSSAIGKAQYESFLRNLILS